jgi:hypothetical protein
MSRFVPMAAKLVAATVVVGAISLAASGAAGAISLSAPKVGPNFNCHRATRVLTRIERVEAHIDKGLPTLTKREAAANARGNTKRADRLAKRIAKLESTSSNKALTKAAQAIEAKCHVSAPT